MQRITITPTDINPESFDVTRDGTRLGIICKDICNGRIQYGAWSMSPDHPRSFAGRYDSVAEAADAVAATWPPVEQPTEHPAPEGDPVDTNAPAPIPCHLAMHPHSGHAAFRQPDDAREWAERQTASHHPEESCHWVSGGEHGWEALRLPDGQTAATVYTLMLDGTLPEYRFASYWVDD